MHFRLALIMLVLFGSLALSILSHEVWHIFQGHSEEWEMCLTNNIEEYNTIAFVKWSGDGVMNLTKDILNESEIAPSLMSILTLLFCTTYCIKNKEIFINKK